jgi:hypothetical protein
MTGKTGALAITILLAACSGDPQPQGNHLAGNAATQFADRMSGTPEPAPPAKPFEKKDNGPQLEFTYAYPAQAAAVPALVERFGARMKQAQADALKMAQSDAAEAKKNGYPFRPHSLETRWTVTADTPRFLALEAESYVYTGGAHGMTGYDIVLWDKARRAETSTAALWTSEKAFGAAIHDRFCAELDKQRATKRGEPVVPGDDDFTKCIDPLKEAIVPTSKDGKLIDGVTVVVGPYSAGPYAEGSYDVALPVDAAMRNAVKTEYQDAFVVR